MNKKLTKNYIQILTKLNDLQVLKTVKTTQILLQYLQKIFQQLPSIVLFLSQTKQNYETNFQYLQIYKHISLKIFCNYKNLNLADVIRL